MTAVVLTRFSWTPLFLSTDLVNLAWGIESFEPLRHQPQPPGYPLFVGFARLVQYFSPGVEVTFWIISAAVSAASAFIIYLLARRMFSQWAGLAAIILLVLNPLFWFTRLQSPLRPWLALFSLLVAYCAWRAWNGERRFVFLGAVALGIGTGFRPDLLTYLLPLWAASAWVHDKSRKTILEGGVIVAALVGVWIGIVVHAMGGWISSIRAMAVYIREQSGHNSLLFAESIHYWLRPISRLIIWNSIAVAGWAWVPVVGYRKLSSKGPWKFLLIWIVPGFIVQLLFHIDEPGHILWAIPALCVAGTFLISSMGRYRNLLLAVAATISSAIFLNAVPLGGPPRPNASFLETALVTARNAVAYGTFETTQERLRWWDRMTEVSLKELWHFGTSDRPNLIIAQNGNDTEFDFMYWRVASYYLEPRPMWLLLDYLPPGRSGRIRLIRGRKGEETSLTSISLPRSERVLWIIQRYGTFEKAIEKSLPLECGYYICYSDIPVDAKPFEIEGFRFIPTGNP